MLLWRDVVIAISHAVKVNFLFIEIYLNVVEAILQYYWSVKCDFKEISKKYNFSNTIRFKLNCMENGNKDS